MSRPFPSRSSAPTSFVRVNGKIRAREVRVIGDDGNQLGVHSLPDAINMARAKGVDLVEIAPNATPPVCRLVDFGKYRYEQSKKEKEAKLAAAQTRRRCRIGRSLASVLEESFMHQGFQCAMGDRSTEL